MGSTGLGLGLEGKQKGIVGSSSHLGPEGESSTTGAIAVGGKFGKEKQSILGKYEWSRKTTQVAESLGVLGSMSPMECESSSMLLGGFPSQIAPIEADGALGCFSGFKDSSMRVIRKPSVDSRDKGEPPRGFPSQTAPIEANGALSCFSGFENSPVRVIGMSGVNSRDREEPMEAVSTLCVHSLIDLVYIPDTTSPLKVAWVSNTFVRDSLSNSILGKYLFVPSLALDVQCLAQSVGDGDSVSDQNIALHGLEMVPFEEGEPISLNWSQSVVVEDSGGVEVANKEVELIMAFSRIVGVSCNGHTNRLKEAFALILANKTYKPNKLSAGGGKAKKKVHVNLLIFSHRLIMKGEWKCDSQYGERKGNRITL